MSEANQLIQNVKKITFRDVIPSVEKEEKLVPVYDENGEAARGDDDKPLMRKAKVAIAGDLFVVYGRAVGHRNATSQFGTTVVFDGDFEARRFKDGQVLVSRECIFPPIAQEMAVQAYTLAKARDESSAVEFAFIIGVVPDAKGTEGFKTTCKMTRGARAESDPLQALKSSLAMNLLPAMGADMLAKIGLTVPGSEALKIGHDPETGEVIEIPPGKDVTDEATPKKTKVSKESEPAE